MNRPLSTPARDIALLLARVIFAVVMFAHGWKKLFVQGIGQTTTGFEKLDVPLAIVSASFVTVLELAGALLLLAGALTTVVSGLYLFQFVGAIVFVHGQNGLFMSDGGAEYVMVICAFVLVLAAAGPGSYSVDAWVTERQRRRTAELDHAAGAPVVLPEPERSAVEAFDFTGPVVLPQPFAPAQATSERGLPSDPASGPTGVTEALPVRRPRAAHASR